jgi:hypothetical protein
MINRRDFIKAGISAAAAFALIKNPLRLFASGSKDEDWVMPEECRLSFVSGRVFVNNDRADFGDAVKEGDVVRTGPGSEAEIEIRDYAVFHIKEESTVRIDDVFLNPRVDVKKGWFLAIIKKGTQFEAGTPLVLAGVRGTVMFMNVLSDDETYFCDCNGRIDLKDRDSGSIVENVVAHYHKSLALRRSGGELDIGSAGMLYHHDEDILKMADRFSRETAVFKNKVEQKGGSAY